MSGEHGSELIASLRLVGDQPAGAETQLDLWYSRFDDDRGPGEELLMLDVRSADRALAHSWS